LVNVRVGGGLLVLWRILSEVRGDGDGWIECTCGRRHWGLYGAAGLLLVRNDTVLVQHRAPWSHNGDTWGLPGGARNSGENAIEAALREANEEAGIQPELIDVVLVQREDHGNWAYDTVIATAQSGLVAYAANHESIEMRWVHVDGVKELDLHPSFAKAWPDLQISIRKALAF
jgi:8-oxo-dGTP diphosphatase